MRGARDEVEIAGSHVLKCLSSRGSISVQVDANTLFSMLRRNDIFAERSLSTASLVRHICVLFGVLKEIAIVFLID